MPFRDSFAPVYAELIKPAIEGAKLASIRSDDLKATGFLFESIAAEIQRSQVIVGDLSTQNPNVLFELGYAAALGKEIVYLTQDGEDVPSDLAGQRYVRYGIEGGMPELAPSLSTTLREAARRARDDEHQKILSGELQHMVPCHGTKFSVPHSHDFWKRLLLEADTRFTLVGHTNRSWLFKTEEQSALLAGAIARIIAQGGTVRIHSDDGDDHIENHRGFFRRHFGDRSEIGTKDVLKRFRHRVTHERPSPLWYTVGASHYGAVLSDDRLLLLPTLNSREFANEACVLEFQRGAHSPQFENYLADIERLFATCKTVDLSSDLRVVRRR